MPKTTISSFNSNKK